MTDPPRIEGPQGSTLTLAIESAATAVAVEQDGASNTLARDREGRFTANLTLTKTGYLVVTAGDRSRTIPVVVSPDALPNVRITVPGRDLVYRLGTRASRSTRARPTIMASDRSRFTTRRCRVPASSLNSRRERFR